MDPFDADGRFGSPIVPRVARPFTVTIGGQPAEVSYATEMPFGWAGLLVVRAIVPQIDPSDFVPVVVCVSDVCSQAGVTMAVR